MLRSVSAVAAFAALVLSSGAAHARFIPRLAAIETGGGIQEFAKGQVRATTAVGGAWDVRVIVGTNLPIAFEGNYIGSVNDEVDPTGNNALLMSTSFDGDLRANLDVWYLQPFAFGGAGWINFHSYGRDHAPEAEAHYAHTADSVVVPVGGGIASYVGHGTIDARFTYRFVPMKDLTDFHERPDMWSASLNAGWAF